MCVLFSSLRTSMSNNLPCKLPVCLTLWKHSCFCEFSVSLLMHPCACTWWNVAFFWRAHWLPWQYVSVGVRNNHLPVLPPSRSDINKNFVLGHKHTCLSEGRGLIHRVNRSRFYSAAFTTQPMLFPFTVMWCLSIQCVLAALDFYENKSIIPRWLTFLWPT